MTGRTRIKICGLRTEADVAAAVDAGADAVGLVFVPGSPRWIDAEQAAELVCALPPLVDSVGVFADAPLEEVIALASDACVGMVQMHGCEDRRLLEVVRDDFAVIRAVEFSADAIAAWGSDAGIDMLLVDGSAGGLGETLDWKSLAAHRGRITRPLILAGGLTPDNVGDAIRLVRPYAVDVSSGVEIERGVKEPALIRAFCDAVREADLSNRAS